MKSFIKRKLDARVQVRTLLRVMGLTLIIATGVVSYLNFTVMPAIVEAATDMWNGEDVVYVRPAVEETKPALDKLDRYFKEEYEANEQKFNDLRKDDARSKAIDRVDTELEVEKEALRDRELFRSAQEQ